jgi:hypothetical protein
MGLCTIPFSDATCCDDAVIIASTNQAVVRCSGVPKLAVAV